ncbi:sulfatase-like hydrolase/transferase [Bacteroidota bacterium]
MKSTTSTRIIISIILAGINTISSEGLRAQTIQEKPNIILILTDQWRGQAVGIANEDKVFTPRLDEIAASGAWFPHAYVTRPICGPNRACIMTGQYPVTNGVYGNSVRMSTASETIGTVAKANGYQTAYIGKWHLDGLYESYVPPERRSGFDYWIMSSGHQPFNQEYYMQDDQNSVRKPDTWEPDWITDRAIEYIRTQHNDPFMVVLSFGPPHTGGGVGFDDRWQPGKRDENGEIKYGYGYAAPSEYENIYPDPEHYPRRPNVEPVKPYDDPSWQTLPGYFGAISSIDHNVGRLVDSLKKFNAFENTILFFTSDHGEMLGSQGRMTKGIWYEESVSVPAIVSYPEMISKTEITHLFSSIDIFPTICGLAGLNVPPQVQGTDFSPVLMGNTIDYPEYVFTSFDQGSPGVGDRSWRGVNTERYTFVLAKKARYAIEDDITDDGMVLYDKSIDPYQMNPIYKGMGYDLVIDSLYDILADQLDKTADPFIEEQWNADAGPFYYYNDALTRDLIPEQKKLNVGIKPDPSDHYFTISDSSTFPFTEWIDIDKSTITGTLALQCNAWIENQSEKQMYVSRFQDRLCISQDLETSLSDYRHIDEGEVLQIIFKMIDIKNANTLQPYDLSLESISFRQMLEDEIAIKKNGLNHTIISSIDSDDDFDYYLPESLDLTQGDSIIIETNTGHWRLNGFGFDVSTRNITSTEDHHIPGTHKLYVSPNPANVMIFIKGLDEDNRITITNVQGKVMHNGYQKEIDITGFLPGIYFVNAGSYKTRFIVN